MELELMIKFSLLQAKTILNCKYANLIQIVKSIKIIINLQKNNQMSFLIKKLSKKC
jgi:hypothetical protein